MKRMAREVAMYLKAYNKTGAGLKSAADGLEKFRSKANKIFADIAKAGAAAFLAVATGAIAIGASFEQGMANTSSMFITAAKSAEELAGWTEQLSVKARELGATTAFTAREATDAMYALASGGMNALEVVKATDGVLKLAGATMTDMTSAAETTMSALKQFGMEADQTDRTVNVFAAGIQNSMLNMERLTNSMVYAGPVMASAGASIEETVAALGLLHNAGLKGSIAGTGLRMSMIKLIKPSGDLKKALNGVSVEEDGLAAVLGELKKANLSTAELVTHFGPRAFGAIKALTAAGKDGMIAMTDAVSGTNAAMDMYEHQMNTVTSQWKILRSGIEETGIAIFDVIRDDVIGVLRDLQDQVEKSRQAMVEMFAVAKKGFEETIRLAGNLSDEYKAHETLINNISSALIGAAAGALIFANVMKVASIAMGAIRAIMATNWIGWLILGIGALIGWIVKVRSQTGGWALEWEEIKVTALRVFASISKAVIGFVVGVRGWFFAIGQYMAGTWEAAKQTFGQMLSDIGTALSHLPDMLFAALRGDDAAAKAAGQAMIDAFSGSAATIFKSNMIAVQTEYNLNMQFAKVQANAAGAEIDAKMAVYQGRLDELKAEMAGLDVPVDVPTVSPEIEDPMMSLGVIGPTAWASTFAEAFAGIADSAKDETDKAFDAFKSLSQGMQSTMQAGWNSILDSSLTGGQKWNAIFDNMKSTAFRVIGQVVTKTVWGEEVKLKSIIFGEKAATTAKVSGAAADTMVTTTKVANATVETAANTGAAASGFFKAFSSIPFVGFALAAVAIAGMLKLLSGLKLAGGGLVNGPGGIDNVPAWLTNQEYVMPVSQTQKYLPILEAMRAGTFTLGEGGGLGLSAAAAAAGPAQPQVVVPVTFERGTLLVTSDDLAVDRLAKRIWDHVETGIKTTYRDGS